jgi:hypothetical protein
MALWIFGDSFSVARENINKGDIEPWHLWHERLANNLGFSRYLNFAQWGVSNEFILDKLLTHQLEYQDGDYIVIQLTSPSRQWFFKEKPELGNYYIVHINKAVTDIECKAIDMYINHLHRPEIDELRYLMLVKALERLSQQLDHCKILILPGFHAIPGVEGTLMNICNGEFVSDKTQASWYDTHFIDPRPNHFGQDNHLILADRITEFFQTSKTVDLENGFKHGFL